MGTLVSWQWQRSLKKSNLRHMKILAQVRYLLPEARIAYKFGLDLIEFSDSIDLSEERLDQGLMGIAHTLKHIAPLFVMCDSGDIHVVPQVKAAHNE